MNCLSPQQLCKSCNGTRVHSGRKTVKLDIMPGIFLLYFEVIVWMNYISLFSYISTLAHKQTVLVLAHWIWMGNALEGFLIVQSYWILVQTRA